MSYRSLLVHVDATDEGRARVRNAVDLARRWSAHLAGLGAEGLEPHPDRMGSSYEFVRTCIEARLAEGEAVFRELAAGLPSCEWRTEMLPPAHAITRRAAGADLVLASRRGDSRAVDVFPDPGELVLGAGAAVLVQPPGGPPLQARRIVLGWKNTRECRRAVSDALPLLTSASAVQVLRFVHDHAGPTDDGLEDVLARLRRHDVPVEAERRTRAERTVADDLMAAAGAFGADLIVSGGFGQPRLRELILGGVTSGLLDRAEQWVLLGH